MTSPSATPEPEPGKLPRSQTERARWATRRMTIRSGKNKRMSILNRRQDKRNGANEKTNGDGKDQSTNGETADNSTVGGVDPEEEPEEENDDRTVFFNIPLPSDQLDEEGDPIRTYARNKVRTAKYTPLSFIPKNLWFQFHNVANIFFLFIVILVVGVNPLFRLWAAL